MNYTVVLVDNFGRLLNTATPTAILYRPTRWLEKTAHPDNGELVAKMQQNAPNRILNFKNFPRVIPPRDLDYWVALPQPPGEREGTARTGSEYDG